MNIPGLDTPTKLQFDLAKATATCMTRCGLTGSIKDPRVASTRLKDHTLKLSEEDSVQCLSRKTLI
jgi:hypothetical protein